MGRYVFKSLCEQWLQKKAVQHLNLHPRDACRWWSRDGKIEIDLVSPLSDGCTLFGACTWSANLAVDSDVLVDLQKEGS